LKIRLSVKVQPRSSRPGVEETGRGEFKVRVKAAPDKGRANAEVIELLAEHFDVPPSRIKIVRGEISRTKIIVIE
jgi:uncharacterized protein (TIGR00251 family)